jgi:hypothetical protein
MTKPITQETLSQQLNEEDYLKIITAEGKKYRRLKVKLVGESSLQVETDDGKRRFTIPYSTIISVERYHVSTWKTIAVFGGIVAVIVGGIYIAWVSSGGIFG